MAFLYSQELAGIDSLPVVKPAASAYAARVRRYRGVITLASQVFATDTILVACLPAGDDFAYGLITSTVSLGSSTISVGVVGTPAKYKSLATFTAVDTPTPFGGAVQVAAPALTAEDRVIVSIGVANLPSSGTLVVEMYTSRP